MTSDPLRWFKSSYSNNGGTCVEIAANAPGVVPVRDSKIHDGPVVIFDTEAFAAFIGGVRNGTV